MGKQVFRCEEQLFQIDESAIQVFLYSIEMWNLISRNNMH